MADRDEALVNFISITGADEAMASNILEACGFQLHQAIELFFASADPQGNAAGPAPAAHLDDEQLARQLQRW